MLRDLSSRVYKNLRFERFRRHGMRQRPPQTLDPKQRGSDLAVGLISKYSFASRIRGKGSGFWVLGYLGLSGYTVCQVLGLGFRIVCVFGVSPLNS